MLKKVLTAFFMIVLFSGLSGSVLAKDNYTTTSSINGVIVNWEYELNESNQIEKLKCTNASKLSGEVTVPSTLDNKIVISLGNDAFKSATSITGITLPNTVKEIGLWAFSGCTSLSNINLGSVEKISDQSFKNCTALKSIKIPKTLNKDASGAPFLGCTNLTNIELEEGMTVVPDCICASTPITEITIPSTVKEIGLWAFSGCTSLSNVNLGSVEKISDQSFKNCTALKSIKIPKTLNKDASGASFIGCTNLTNIELEEGMTVVPDCICASTPITEITIPSTVKEIGLWAFKDCNSLKKITILDNVTDIEGYDSSSTDLVFQNHNDDLTIYCYENSMAAKYAIKYNIKYVYLSRPTSETFSDESKLDASEPGTTKIDTTPITKPVEENDKTLVNGVLPHTGITITGLVMVLSISILSSIFYIKCRKYRDI